MFMNKLEKVTLTTTENEVVFVEPAKDNAINKYNADLPQEYKKSEFMDMPEYWQFRQIEAYCEFMKEVMPKSVQRDIQVNTMIGVSLAKIDFPNFAYEGIFPSTHTLLEQHQVKVNINFDFDYEFQNQKNADPKTTVELFESEDKDEKSNPVNIGDKINNLWNKAEGVIPLAHKVFNDFPNLKEDSKLLICSGILMNIQNAIDCNAKDYKIESAGFTNAKLDPNSELAKKMASANMAMTLDVVSPQYSPRSKTVPH